MPRFGLCPTARSRQTQRRNAQDVTALKEQTIADKNIFYLDLIGAVELEGMNFVGGTLFFDGSMRIRENQRVDEWDGWQDWRIGEIVMRYMEFNAYYVDMIKSKMKPGISRGRRTPGTGGSRP